MLVVLRVKKSSSISMGEFFLIWDLGWMIYDFYITGLILR
jgi:hypothetical protein